MLLQSTTATAASRIEIIQSIERRSGPNSKCPRGGWLPSLPSFFRILPPPLSILRPSPAFDPGLPVPLFSDRTCPSCLSLLLGERGAVMVVAVGHAATACARERTANERASERATRTMTQGRPTPSLPPSPWSYLPLLPIDFSNGVRNGGSWLPPRCRPGRSSISELSLYPSL